MKSTIKILALIIGLILLSQAGVEAQAACKCKLPIDNTFQIAPMTLGHDTDVGVPPLYENDNATTPAMPLPFSFCFYGHRFDSVFISNNGIVSFVKPIFNFIDSTQSFPLGADTLMIAPFYADANTLNNAGKVYYKITQTYMVVIWDSVRFAGTDVDGWNRFQLVITDGSDPIVPDGNNISFCYPIMQWACSESSGGFSGYGGTPAFVGINRGDGVHYAQLSRFSLPGDFYFGPFSALNGVDWLDFQSFTLNSCVLGNILPPVVCNNIPAAQTLYICPCDTSSRDVALGAPDSIRGCDTVSMGAQFICAVQGQSAVLSYSVTGALNIYSVHTRTANIIDSIIVQAIPAYGDTGVHILTLTATDTVSHVQSSVTYTINVTMDCQNIPPPDTTGVIDRGDRTGFSVYPNPAGRNIVIDYNKNISNAVVKIYEVEGTEVFSAGLSTDRSDIDISHLARGMYFVELYRDGIPLSIKKIILL